MTREEEVTLKAAIHQLLIKWDNDGVAMGLRVNSAYMYHGILAVITSALAELAQCQQDKDGAYLERNRVVAALAKCFSSGVARTSIDGWSDDWDGCVYIDLPTGQVSWHYHDSHAELFAGLPAYTKPWDGHDTDEKYRRVAALTKEQWQQRAARLREVLRELYAVVRGECPSLLNEDSGGDAELSLEIERALEEDKA